MCIRDRYRLILLSGLFLVTACAGPDTPFATLEAPDSESGTQTVEAMIPEQEPSETITYEPEYPQNLALIQISEHTRRTHIPYDEVCWKTKTTERTQAMYIPNHSM